MHLKTDEQGGLFIYKGGDRMNFLRICRYLYTKKLLGEIVLFIQLMCMLEMSFVVLKPVDSYLMEKKTLKAAYVSDLDSMVHFSKNNLIYELSPILENNSFKIGILYNINKLQKIIK